MTTPADLLFGSSLGAEGARSGLVLLVLVWPRDSTPLPTGLLVAAFCSGTVPAHAVDDVIDVPVHAFDDEHGLIMNSHAAAQHMGACNGHACAIQICRVAMTARLMHHGSNQVQSLLHAARSARNCGLWAWDTSQIACSMGEMCLCVLLVVASRPGAHVQRL